MNDRLNILLIGGGGREHALAWKIAASPLTAKLWCAPGNAGIAEICECIVLDASDAAAVTSAPMWSPHSSSRLVSSRPAPIAPLRSRSSTLSTTWVKLTISSNPNSPYYNEELITKGVGIRFNGVEKTNVDEYCISEGWVRVTAGNAKDRFGNPMTIKLKGKVEPYLQAKE